MLFCNLVKCHKTIKVSCDSNFNTSPGFQNISLLASGVKKNRKVFMLNIIMSAVNHRGPRSVLNTLSILGLAIK